MDSGEIVSLRITTPAGPTELVGQLVEQSAESLVVRRRDGAIQEVRRADIVAGRVVPPGPARRIGAADLAQITALGLRALEIEPLGSWSLRAAGGVTARANSALAVGDPGRPLAEAVDAVAGWYAARGLAPRAQVVREAAPAGLEELLADRGWQPEWQVDVMTAEIAPVLRAARPPVVDVRIDAEPDDAWLAAYRAEDADARTTAGADLTRALLTNHGDAGFASVREGERCLAVARAAVAGPLTGLFAVETATGVRRQGLARAVSIAALRWAARRGARHGYLQVAHGNEPARQLYERLGFAPHSQYAHWRPG